MKNKKHLKYKVYFLPAENYCGMTGRPLSARLWQHRKNHQRNTEGAYVIASFETKRQALDFEKMYQLDNSCKGFVYTESWKRFQAERDLDYLREATRKSVICNSTMQIFESVRSCERFYSITSGNLSKHLKGNKNYTSLTKQKLTFSYYGKEEKCDADRD